MTIKNRQLENKDESFYDRIDSKISILKDSASSLFDEKQARLIIGEGKEHQDLQIEFEFKREKEEGKISLFKISQYSATHADQLIYKAEFSSDFLYSWTKSIKYIFYQNSILKNTLKSSWLSCKYLKEYSAFLMGSYSESEFSEIAEKYSLAKRKIDKKDIVDEVQIILDDIV